MSEVFRQFRIKAHLFAGNGVDKPQCFCVQALPVQAGDAVVRAVDRVACHRVLDGRHVHTDWWVRPVFRRHSSMVKLFSRSST